MKLSFSIPSKTQSTSRKPPFPNPAGGEDSTTDVASEIINREYVTEFDSSKPQHDSSNNNVVIRPIDNVWRPEKRMKNLDPLLQSDVGGDRTLQFVLDSTSSSAAETSMSYGLNLRCTEPKLNSVSDIGDPTLIRLRGDLERLPESGGFDQFEDVPVESFAVALLAGYGWREGKGIGRGWDKKEDVKVVEIQRRTAKEGLGFTGELPNLPPKHGGQNADGGGDHGKKIREVEQRSGGSGRVEVKSGEKRGLFVGKDVRIVGGSNMGMKGRVLEVKRDGKHVLLRVSGNEDGFRVRVGDVADLGSVEEENCLKKLREERRLREKNEVNKSKRGSETSGRKSSAEGKKGIRDAERKVCWLTSNIRVRIISKDLKGGRLYLKKGEIVDVVGPTTCDISMDDSKELIQGVDQYLLETAIPKRGGPVLVLYGEHKGVYGSLVERNAEKETGVIKDNTTHELIDVPLEQIAEYVGDPSYIGY